MKCDRCNYFSFWAIFCHFTPQQPQKSKLKKKKMKKRPGYIIILHECTKNHDHMLYCSWDMAHGRCNCYFSFWANSRKNQNFEKIYKIPGDVIILHMCTKNYDQMIYGSRDRQTDGWTVRQKKWHIEVGAPPKNRFCRMSLNWFDHLLELIKPMVMKKNAVRASISPDECNSLKLVSTIFYQIFIFSPNESP